MFKLTAHSRTQIRRVTGVFAGCLATVPAMSPSAHACSSVPRTDGTVPPSGCTRASNAAVILRGVDLGPFELTASVDGARAPVEIGETLHTPDGAFDGVLVPLAAPPGTTVALSGRACGEDQGCAIEAHWPTGAQAEPPAHAVVDVVYDVHDWNPGDPDLCEAACSNADLALHVTVTSQLTDDPSGVPVLIDVRVGLDEGGDDRLQRTSLLHDTEQRFVFATRSAEVPSPDALCVRARLRTTAGAASAWVQSGCAPCRIVREDPQSPGACMLAPPDWDLLAPTNPAHCGSGVPPAGVPAAACVIADEGDTSGEAAADADADTGCRCGGAPASSPWLVLAVLVRRRARARRRGTAALTTTPAPRRR